MDHTLAKIINTSQYVSFDIFDTAIIRNVLEQSDVFTLVQKQYDYCHSELLPNYPKLRQKA
ncbi:hypothetical protein BJP34_22775 [Moorena producens PAL-8-15-08-1]|uniref:Uncharacterized protein n=2 Tax=Moorena TaxID=1155738 RepID=A0A1D8TW52_9CYAN|nr:hypothetical protein BJP34_22775 [Moorena producens PAL-8-15-08-1]OLT60576.1 hypothetical protein BJP37_17735 [Moorena bouillonii PNG]